MEKIEYIHILYVLAIIVISNTINYIIRISLSGKELNSKLISNNVYIITNDFCKCHNIRFGNINLYKIKCNLCKINNVINFERDKDIYKLLETIGKKVKFLIHTSGGETDLPNFLTYILKQNNVYVETFIPEMALSAGSFIALCSNIIYMNWYSSMGPVDTQVDYGSCDSDDENCDESFPAKYIKTITKKNNAITKLRSMESEGYHNDDLFILGKMFKKKKRDLIVKHFLETKNSHSIRYGPKDVGQYGLNVKIGLPTYISDIFNDFKKLYD